LTGPKEGLQFGLQQGLGHEANEPGEQLAILEEQHAGDAGDSVGAGDLLVRIHVELDWLLNGNGGGLAA
jgi:hypothetical protein